MNASDVDLTEMSDHENMNERDVDRLFDGRVDACGQPDIGVEAFFADLRASHPEASTLHCEQEHLSAMFREAHLIIEKGEPVARPASKADGPAAQASGLPMWRERVMARFSGLTLGARIAAAATLLVFAFTGVAVAGGLPRPVQHAVSHAASVIGVTIPDPEDANEIEAPEVEDVQGQDDASEIESNDQGQQPVAGEEATDAQDDQDEAASESHDGAKADADDESDTNDDAEEARSADDNDEQEAVTPRESDSSDHESDDSAESEAGADD